MVVAVVVGDSREYMSACTSTAKYLRKQPQCDAVITATPQPTTKPIKLPKAHCNTVAYIGTTWIIIHTYIHTYIHIYIPRESAHPVQVS